MPYTAKLAAKTTGYEVVKLVIFSGSYISFGRCIAANGRACIFFGLQALKPVIAAIATRIAKPFLYDFILIVLNIFTLWGGLLFFAHRLLCYGAGVSGITHFRVLFTIHQW